MWRWLWLSMLLGCGGSHGLDGGDGIDGGTIEGDGGAMDVAPSFDADSCAGYEEGYTICPGDTRTCCGGTWRHYFDGACWDVPDVGVVDAGSPCDRDATSPGCPCATEGEIACPMFDWQRVCTAGVWAERFPIVCCSTLGF